MSRVNAAQIVSRGELPALGNRLRAEGKRIVFTNGCFDVLHVGHLRYLRQARELGDVLVVGLNTDAGVRRLKGNSRPVVPESDRAEMLSGLSCVDYVTVFDEPLPVETIAALRPHVHAKGGDYRAEDLPEAECVHALGGEVVILPLVPGRSTTEMLTRIKEV